MTGKVLPFRRPERRDIEPRLNLRDICNLVCKTCGKEWVAPVPTDDVACPTCHGTNIVLLAESIRRENAVRVN